MVKNRLLPTLDQLNDMEFLKDFFRFLKDRKKWFLMPIIIVILIVGGILIFGGGGAVAPFIYSLF